MNRRHDSAQKPPISTQAPQPAHVKAQVAAANHPPEASNADDLAALLRELLRLPLTPEERAAAVRRLLRGGG